MSRLDVLALMLVALPLTLLASASTTLLESGMGRYCNASILNYEKDKPMGTLVVKLECSKPIVGVRAYYGLNALYFKARISGEQAVLVIPQSPLSGNMTIEVTLIEDVSDRIRLQLPLRPTITFPKRNVTAEVEEIQKLINMLKEVYVEGKPLIVPGEGLEDLLGGRNGAATPSDEGAAEHAGKSVNVGEFKLRFSLLDYVYIAAVLAASLYLLKRYPPLPRRA